MVRLLSSPAANEGLGDDSTLAKYQMTLELSGLSAESVVMIGSLSSTFPWMSEWPDDNVS